MQHWQTNLKIIAQRWPNLYHQLKDRPIQPLNLGTSRTQQLVPLVNNKALHSSYDPVREAQKTLIDHADSYVILGLGGGYLAQAILAKATTKLLIIIEPDHHLLASLLAYLCLAPLLNDPRLQLVSQSSPALNIKSIQQYYQPLLHGNLQYVAPRAMRDLYEHFSGEFTLLWQKWLESLTTELSTWGYFGRRWLKNIIINLSQMSSKATVNMPDVEHALVAGAGPSLQQALPHFKKQQAKGAIIIASDAAALCLSEAGIPIDIILSIDAQVIVHSHFLALKEQHALLLSDLSAQPKSPYKGERLFFAGSHPLANLSGLPHLSTASGNVGSVAYHLAKELGAKKIQYAGLDFAYLGAKAYAKPNYLYNEYLATAHRLNPMSQALSALTFRSMPINYDSQTHTYQSPLLAFYQQNFQQITQQRRPTKAWQHHHIDGRAFLRAYRQELKALPKINALNFHALSPKELQLLYTLLPAAVHGYQQGLGDEQVVEESKSFTLAILEQALS